MKPEHPTPDYLTRLMPPGERGVVALCHLSTVIPVWALAVDALIYFLYRETSRAICFHARQGIHFQFLFLLCVIPLSFLYLLNHILREVLATLLTITVADRIFGWMEQGINATLTVLFIAYAAFCITGFFQALRGRVFLYPFTVDATGKKAEPSISK
ncbi:TPA: hypothetical protein DDW35_13835 [Candidatus Sumerlaeota bacterium]|jgi:uncharacterized Tic20 family protein|nr:hypothetical protein [Candidatus Sumerlaeota bacterium]